MFMAATVIVSSVYLNRQENNHATLTSNMFFELIPVLLMKVTKLTKQKTAAYFDG